VTSRRPIRAVFFDAGNTLLRMNYGVIAEQLAVLGRPVAEAAIQRANWQALVRLDADLFAPALPGSSTENPATAERYLRYLLEGVGIVDEPTIAAVMAWRRAYKSSTGLFNVVDPNAIPALRAVRDAGLSAAVISNSDGSARTSLERLGLLTYLDFVLDSGEVGVEKPDPRIFRLALERAGLEPPEAAYIGDLYSIDVRGAQAAGLHAILLDPGACWGARDCVAATDVLDAVRRVLDGNR
jgi:putative hydrolase of the HAD superfamily